MAQYIDKAAVVAEIKRQILAIDNMPKITDTQISVLSGNKVILTKLLSFIDTLEVKEADLEKEIQDHIRECLDVKFPTTNIELIKTDVAYTAKKFFELGLKAQKGE